MTARFETKLRTVRKSGINNRRLAAAAAAAAAAAIFYSFTCAKALFMSLPEKPDCFFASS